MTVALIGVFISTGQTASASTPGACAQTFDQATHAHYARAVYKRPEMSRTALRRVERMRRCQSSPKAVRNALSFTREMRRQRRVRQEAADALTPFGDWAVPERIVMCESGGDFHAVNGSNPNRPAGAYQVITSTWLAHGGGAFAPTADAATPAEQHKIAGRILASGGLGQWECS